MPLARRTFGDEFALYADSNGPYDFPKAIEIGRLLKDWQRGFFEEPCPFDHLEEGKEVPYADSWQGTGEQRVAVSLDEGDGVS